MKKNVLNYITVTMGILLLGIGVVCLKSIHNPQGILQALPYICIGIGCGAFGHGMGNIINNRVFKKHPDQQKQMEIEKNDERNVSISNRAKAKAYDMMVFLFGALMISFALMNVDWIAVILLVLSYLFVVGYGIYYRIKYENEM